MKCPRCNKNKAIIDPKFGITWCKECRKRKSDLSGVRVEMVPEYIKSDRKENFNSIVQPWRSGEPSREFIEAHPEAARKTYTPQEMKRAKYCWRDLSGWSGRSRSK